MDTIPILAIIPHWRWVELRVLDLCNYGEFMNIVISYAIGLSVGLICGYFLWRRKS